MNITRTDADRKKAVKEAAEQAKQAEIERQKETERLQQEEQAKLEANKQRIGKIRREAKEFLMSYVGKSTAKKIVLVISNGDIINVTINY